MKLAIASLLFGSAAAFSPALSGNKFTSSTQLSARKPFISGNWKLNPQTKDEALELAANIAASINEGSPDADVALFVPYVFIESVMDKVGDWINIGAEVSFKDLFLFNEGVF
jgi:triosephosphate isomerase